MSESATPLGSDGYAEWLRTCSSELCSPEHLGPLDGWARQKILRRGEDENIFAALQPGPGNTAPAFKAFETYCYEYPKTQGAKPSYKNLLKELAHSQSPSNSMRYATTFFMAIARGMRADLIALEKNSSRFVQLFAEREDESTHHDDNLSMLANKAGVHSGEIFEDEHEKEEALLYGTKCAEHCFQALTARQKLFFWANFCGLANSHPSLLARAGCQKSVAATELHAADAILRETAKKHLPLEYCSQGGSKAAVHNALAALEEMLLTWAESEKLDPAAFTK